MKLYKTRQVTVEAVLWTGENAEEMEQSIGFVPVAVAPGFYYVRRSGHLDVLSGTKFHATYEPLLDL